MDENGMPTKHTNDSLNEFSNDIPSGTSKHETTPKPEDNLEIKNELPNYESGNILEPRSDPLQADIDKNEMDIAHAGESLNECSSKDPLGASKDENTPEHKILEDTSPLEKAFDDHLETKNEFPKYEGKDGLEPLQAVIDKNKMDTSHTGESLNGFSSEDLSVSFKDEDTPRDTPELKTFENTLEPSEKVFVEDHLKTKNEVPKAYDIPETNNEQGMPKSIKDKEMLEPYENEHKQKHSGKKDMIELLYNENNLKYSNDDDIYLETIKISHDLENNLKQVPGALDYIKKLHHLIYKHIKKIRKLRKKLNEQTTKNYKDSYTQTDVERQHSKADVSGITEEENKTELESKPKSLAEDIAEAAEMAMQNSGFVYEETSGMYYDYNTGYYYNAEYGLYYDGSTGTYMTYNQDTQTYEFHSQVSVQVNQQPEKKPDRRKRKNKGSTAKERSKRKRKQNEDGSTQDDVEEGECSDSCESSSVTDDESSEHESDSSEISKAAPCMRVIVEASEVPSMKVGSLFIITRDGGSLGREGHHSIIIGDLNVSKHHLKFTFEEKDGCYHVTDLGSRNGTLLNGKRLSPSKQESELSKILHGSKIQIGSTILLCHIHDGTQTCGHCEPGLLQEQNTAQEAPRIVIRYNRAERHKNELRSLKKLCGVKSYNADSKLAEGYTDRAQRRRDTVGSQNPHEKTQVASVDESISKENKGFKLLQKMGWKEGESLGKENEGIVEPIKVTANQGTTGIGAEASVLPVKNEKSTIWVKTQERFNKLPESKDILGLDSD